MIRVSIDFKDKKRFDNLIRYIENMSFVRAEAELALLADKTVEEMKNTINSSRKRPDKGTHKLENSIDWTEVLNNPGKELIIGIGNIDKITLEAPYWEMINDGATYITKTHHIVPFEDGEFRTFKVGSSHVIEGIDYVGKSIRNLDKELLKVCETLGGNYINEINEASK